MHSFFHICRMSDSRVWKGRSTPFHKCIITMIQQEVGLNSPLLHQLHFSNLHHKAPQTLPKWLLFEQSSSSPRDRDILHLQRKEMKSRWNPTRGKKDAARWWRHWVDVKAKVEESNRSNPMLLLEYV